MYRCNSKRLAFVHIPKTGGSSILVWLRRQSFTWGDDGHPYHESVVATRSRIGNSWGSYYSFAVVRNPWERLVSLWLYLQKPRDNEFVQRVQREIPSFEAFLTHESLWGMTGEPTVEPQRTQRAFTRSQRSYLTDARGKIDVSFIARFERLEHDMRVLRERMNFYGYHQPLPRINAADQRYHYRDFYTPKTRQLVADRFADDIAEFGYDY